jgi:hypothetical protein
MKVFNFYFYFKGFGMQVPLFQRNMLLPLCAYIMTTVLHESLSYSTEVET